MKIAIIGAGKMGKWFTKFFLEEGNSLIVVDTNRRTLKTMKEAFDIDISEKVEVVKKAEKIFLCVPIDQLETVVKEVGKYTLQNQVIMDIASIKSYPVRVMHKHIKKGTVLGVHPVFGPGAEGARKHKFILTPTNNKERECAERFKEWLEQRQATVYIMSPKEHDTLMSTVLGLPHFLGMVSCDTILSCSHFVKSKKVAGPSYNLLLTLAEAVSSEKSDFYATLQLQLPEMENIIQLFIDNATDWLKYVKGKDKAALIGKMDEVKRTLKRKTPSSENAYKRMYKFYEINEK